jgi:hypothetical protein
MIALLAELQRLINEWEGVQHSLPEPSTARKEPTVDTLADISEEFKSQLERHFTAGELVEFMGLTVHELCDKLEDRLRENYIALVEETCFSFDRDEEDDE